MVPTGARAVNHVGEALGKTCRREPFRQPPTRGAQRAVARCRRREARIGRLAPVAQLDRASVYGTEGREFESLRARSQKLRVCEGFAVSDQRSAPRSPCPPATRPRLQQVDQKLPVGLNCHGRDGPAIRAERMTEALAAAQVPEGWRRGRGGDREPAPVGRERDPRKVVAWLTWKGASTTCPVRPPSRASLPSARPETDERRVRRDSERGASRCQGTGDAVTVLSGRGCSGR